MKTYFDCIPCFFKQALEASKLAGADDKTRKKIINETAKKLIKFPMDTPPPLMGRTIYALARKLTKNYDPYLKLKRKSNKLALGEYKHLKRKVSNSSDRLFTAIKLAVAGNIIDYGLKESINIEKELSKILNEEHKTIKRENKKLFDYASLKTALKSAVNILYIGDNSGEIVFDRILIEELSRMNKKVTFAVKSRPIINDALLEDAYTCGIDKTSRVITSGMDAPGTVLKLCSKGFKKEFRKADLIISKGQGNYESLSREKGPIFFLFMAKCEPVAKHLKCSLRDIILLKQAKRIINLG